MPAPLAEGSQRRNFGERLDSVLELYELTGSGTRPPRAHDHPNCIASSSTTSTKYKSSSICAKSETGHLAFSCKILFSWHALRRAHQAKVDTTVGSLTNRPAPRREKPTHTVPATCLFAVCIRQRRECLRQKPSSRTARFSKITGLRKSIAKSGRCRSCGMRSCFSLSDQKSSQDVS